MVKSSKNIFWFDSAAEDFGGINSALPLGNGFIGAQIEDNLVFENITLNESTLFTGGKYQNHIDGACKHLQSLRKRTLAGEPCDVEWGGEFVGMFGGQIFAPAGNLVVYSDIGKDVTNYTKQIDLEKGVLTTTFKADGKEYNKNYFASHPDNVLVLRYDFGGAKRGLTFEYLSKTDGEYSFLDSKTAMFSGRAPGGKGVCGAIKFCVCYTLETDGKVQIRRNKLMVLEATYCEVFLAIETNFISVDNLSKDYYSLAVARVKKASKNGYNAVYDCHINDFSLLYNRTYLSFDEVSNDNSDECLSVTSINNDCPTFSAIMNEKNPKGKSISSNLMNEQTPKGKPISILMNEYPETQSVEFIEKMFNYDKYLICSCTRTGSQPPTLQGRWNASYTPPWDSKYTTNINLEMNYYSVGALNMCDMAMPLVDKVLGLMAHGKQTAKEMYGISRGDSWVLHHNTDLWNVCGAIDGPWGLTPVCGAWLTNTVFDFYRYTLDLDLLKKFYPALKGAVEFFAEFLVEYDFEGKKFLVTCPSTSPERTNGKQGYVSYGSSHDNQTIRQLLENFIEAATVLKLDDALIKETIEICAKIAPPASVSSSGVLKEFYFHDNDRANDTHRHLSHLYGIHPSSLILREDNPNWLNAAEFTLDCRSKEGDWAGWGIVWRIYMYSRLMRAEKAEKMVDLLLNKKTGLLLPNGFAAHPYETGHIFQYDANAGFPGALLEMFVSCPNDTINLLPSVPRRLSSGEIRGVRVFGGFIVSYLIFKNGVVTQCVIASSAGGILKVTVNGELKCFDTLPHESIKVV